MSMNRAGQTYRDGTIRFLSWNVRGMNHPVKRRKIYMHLNTLQVEIIFLQETYQTLSTYHPWMGISDISSELF